MFFVMHVEVSKGCVRGVPPLRPLAPTVSVEASSKNAEISVFLGALLWPPRRFLRPDSTSIAVLMCNMMD
jgi:hypothetical protein